MRFHPTSARARMLLVLLTGICLLPGLASGASIGSSAARHATSNNGLWSIGDTAEREQIQCCTVQQRLGASASVCLDRSALGQDFPQLLVRHSPDVGKAIRTLSWDCNMQGNSCLGELWNHSLPEVSGQTTVDSASLLVGQIRVPTTLVRPGEILRGVVFARIQMSEYQSIFTRLSPEHVEDLKLTFQASAVESGAEQPGNKSPLAIFRWKGRNTSTTDVDSLLQFDIPISQFWTPATYALTLSYGSSSLQSIPIQLGHHVKHSINVTATLQEPWVVPGRPLVVNISSTYFFGMPVEGASRARVSMGGQNSQEEHLELVAGTGQANISVLPGAAVGRSFVLAEVVDVLGRTGEARLEIEVVQSVYRANISGIPSIVAPHSASAVVVDTMHRGVPRMMESERMSGGTLTLSVRKHTMVGHDGYPPHCNAFCASVADCARYDGNRSGCNQVPLCAYYNTSLVPHNWCDPQHCVACWEEAMTSFNYNESAPLFDGQSSVQIFVAGPGAYTLRLTVRSEDGIVIHDEESPLTVRGSAATAEDGLTGSRSTGGDEKSKQYVRFVEQPRVKHGSVQGAITVVGANGTARVLLDLYGVRDVENAEVSVGEDVANFSIPISEQSLQGQSLRLDAYLAPALPPQRPQIFFDEEYDAWGFGNLYGGGRDDEYVHPDLISDLVHVGRPACNAFLESNINGSSFTGSLLPFRLSVDDCFLGGSAALMLVDAGVASQDSYSDPAFPSLPRAPASATTRLGSVALRKDMAVSTGVSPSCVGSLPARITVSGWGLSDGARPPNITVGGDVCKVVSMRRVYVQQSAASSRGKWVRWVDCIANSTGKVDVTIKGKRFFCSGACSVHRSAACSEAPVVSKTLAELQEPLCDRYRYSNPAMGKDIDTPVVGISLGMSHSAVGIYKNGRVEIIPNKHGQRLTPSYVAVSDGKYMFGQDAKDYAAVDPKQTLFGLKRLIGRRFDDESVQSEMEHLPYKVVSDTNSSQPLVSLMTDGEETLVTPEEALSWLVSGMKDIGEHYLGKEVRHAVIAVPAYFNDAQRQATRNAGTLAGMNVLRIINEPTAAAIAYGLDRRTEEYILVYDWGGHMLDVSLLTIDNGVFEVIATHSIRLGGEDFNQRAVQHLTKVFQQKHGQNITQNKRAMRRLQNVVELSKKQLSSLPGPSSLDIEALHAGIDFTANLTRARFEELNRDLFRSSLELVKQVLNESGLRRGQVDEIVLAGGSTRIPKVRQILTDFFQGKEPIRGMNPDEVVAYGAAMQAGILSGAGGQDLLLLDVTPLTLGIALQSGKIKKIVPRNTVIPTQKFQIVPAMELPRTPSGTCRLIVYEGEHAEVHRNHGLGELTLPCSTSVEVTFKIDSNGILTVDGRDPVSYVKETLVISNDKGCLTEEEIERMIREAEDSAGDDQDSTEDALQEERKERSDFRESIVLPPVRLEQRITEIPVSMPDAVTSWHVKAVVASTEELQTVSVKEPVAIVNPIFSSTLTPPFLALSDEVVVPTVVENTMGVWLHNVSVAVHHNSALDVECVEELCIGAKRKFIGNIPPSGRGVAYWRLRAKEVGRAALNTTVSIDNPKFIEKSTLQTPLTIGPPGTPHVNTSRGKVTSEGFEIMIDVDHTSAYAVAVINVMPFQAKAFALEGMQALAKYPYGCCEQTSSATFSNLVALRHAVGEEGPLKDLLSYNLQRGRDRLLNHFRKASGAFGMWQEDKDGDVFHTAVVMGLLGSMRPYTTVPEIVFQTAASFLRQQQRPDGGYGHLGEFTAYVLHNEALASVTDSKAFEYLLNRYEKLDESSLALLTRAAFLSKLGTPAERMALLHKLQSMAKCDERYCFWPRAASISSSVETTAYAISAVALAGADSCLTDGQELMNKAIAWLLRERSAAGWRSTIDTLWAAHALADITSYLSPVPKSESTIAVSVDGDIVHKILITPDTQDEALTAARAMFTPLPVGSHKISVACDGNCTDVFHTTVEVRTYTHAAPTTSSWIVVESHVSDARKQSGSLRGLGYWTVPMHLTLRPNKSDWRYKEASSSLMIEVPVPAAMELSAKSFWALSKHELVRHVEINTEGPSPVLGFFLDSFEEPLSLDLEFTAHAALNVTVGSVRVLPMYQPEHAVAAAGTRVEIAA